MANDRPDGPQLSRDGVVNRNLQPQQFPAVKTVAEVNGHLINDHEYTEEGAGSTRPPRLAELKRQHAWVHKWGMSENHNHTHDDGHAAKNAAAAKNRAAQLKDLEASNFEGLPDSDRDALRRLLGP